MESLSHSLDVEKVQNSLRGDGWTRPDSVTDPALHLIRSGDASDAEAR